MNQAIKRILVVDDEVTFLNTVNRHLRRKGFSLETAGNGKSASSLIRRRAETGSPFDLVISDVVMPGMDGIELLGWIKERFPETSVILLTGFGEGDAVRRAVRPEFDAFGAKPITPEKMLHLIRKISGRREHMEGNGRKTMAVRPARKGEGMEPRRILVIDDEAPILRLFRRALEPVGAIVDTVSSGKEGVEKMQEAGYDLVFLDLNMPRPGGIETLRALRRIDDTATIYIVTGFYDRYVDDLRAVSEEENISFEILHKPVEPLALRAIVAEMEAETAGSKKGNG